MFLFMKLQTFDQLKLKIAQFFNFINLFFITNIYSIKLLIAVSHKLSLKTPKGCHTVQVGYILLLNAAVFNSFCI